MSESRQLLQWLWTWVPRVPYRAILGYSDEHSPGNHVDPIRKRAPDVDELLASYPSEAFPFENIAFEGGGVKGIAHTGGMRVGSVFNQRKETHNY